MVVTYVRGTGRLSLDRYDFSKHINGLDFRQKASTVDTDLTYTGLGNATTVKEALDWLNTHGGGGGGGGVVDLSDLGSTTGILPIVRGGTGLSTIGGSGTVFTSDGTAGIWQTIVNSNISASAAIAASKLAAGTNGFVLTTTGGIPTWAAITNTNIASGAAIAVTKLAAGADNTVLISSSGSTGWTTINNSNIASGANIAVNKIAAGTNSFVLTTVGGSPAWAPATTGGGGSNVDLYGPTIEVNLDGNGVADSLDIDGYPAATIIIQDIGSTLRGISNGQALTSRRLIVKFRYGGTIEAFENTSDVSGADRINASNPIVFDQADDSIMLWWGEEITEGPTCWGAVKLSSNGEANTTSNSGSGVGLAQTKSGVDLPFKSLIGGTNITITPNSNDITISATGEANTASTVGSGVALTVAKSGVNLPFKGLVAGSNITLTPSTDSVVISATSSGGSGEVNTASNLGSGQGWFNSKVGVDLQFKSFRTTSPLGLSISSTEIGINLGGLSGFGTSLQVLRMNSSATAMEWGTVSGGTTSPAGTTGEPQINASGVFGVPGGITMGSGFMSMGSTVATIGRIRTPNNSGVAFIAQRNSANSADLVALAANTATLYVGANSNLTSSFTNVQIFPNTQISMGLNGTTAIEINPTNILVDRPIIGQVSPYGVHGLASITITASRGLDPTEYKSAIWSIIGTNSSSFSVTIPSVSSADRAYFKIVSLAGTGLEITFTTGSGTNVTMTTSASPRAVLLVTSFGCSIMKFQ